MRPACIFFSAFQSRIELRQISANRGVHPDSGEPGSDKLNHDDLSNVG